VQTPVSPKKKKKEEGKKKRPTGQDFSGLLGLVWGPCVGVLADTTPM
jgi:hypothetical protein